MSAPNKATQTDRIRALNDELRQNLSRGRAVITTGIAALGPEAVARILQTIEVFDDFCHANDPHQEHDFGSFEAEGERIFFKIDYFDRTMTVILRIQRTQQSPSASSPLCWQRNTEFTADKWPVSRWARKVVEFPSLASPLLNNQHSIASQHMSRWARNCLLHCNKIGAIPVCHEPPSANAYSTRDLGRSGPAARQQVCGCFRSPFSRPLE